MRTLFGRFHSRVARLQIALLAFGLASCLVANASGAQPGDPAEARDSGLSQEFERGPVRVQLSISPEAPVIGDVIELVLEVTSAEGVEVLMPEFGEALGRFEIVDFAPSERLAVDGQSVARQKYRLQPMRSGAQSIPPLRVEFIDRRPGQESAPEGEDAYEILTDRLRLEVEPILAADAPLVLKAPLGDLGPRRKALLPWWGWLLIATLVLVAAAPFAYRTFLAARARQRQKSAYELARGELDGLLAEGDPDASRMDAFYVRLSQIVRTYLEDRFGLRSPELTTQEFLTEMGRSPDLARSHQQLLRDFLQQADLVKFAGHRPTAEDVSVSVAAAERFLEETRDQVRSETPAEASEVGHA